MPFLSASRPPELRRLRQCERYHACAASGPPPAPRNCGDCGISGTPNTQPRSTASRPPELRRLRPSSGLALLQTRFRLTPPGIAATAAFKNVADDKEAEPPHAPRNCGDC